MAMPFTQTLRGLETDSPRSTLLVWAAASLGLLVWGVWLAGAHVTLYASAASARLETVQLSRQIAVPTAGLVLDMRVHLGDSVKAGEILARLDATAETLAVAAQKTQTAALQQRIVRLRNEIAARTAARRDSGAAATAEADIAQTRVDEARAALEYGRGRLERLEGLAKTGGIAASDVLKAKADVDALAAQNQGAVSDVLRIGLRGRADDRRAAAEIDALETELDGLEAQLADARTTQSVLEQARDRRTLRAPVDGRIGAISTVAPGSYIAAGAPILSLVPDGSLKIVAAFDAATDLGRLASGQPATARRIGGADRSPFAATVAAVAAEPVDGELRVELSLDAATTDRLDLRHAQTLAVDVATGEVTPLQFVLAALGWRSS